MTTERPAPTSSRLAASRAPRIAGAGLLLAATAACGDDTTAIVAIDPPESDRCTQSIPRTFQVYFVINVSGSMDQFLEPLSDQLETFVQGFPEVDVNGDRLLVDYYVVAFVNDFSFFPPDQPRMSRSFAVGQAIDDALTRASDNRNLDGSDNGDPPPNPENMLDALDAALDRAESNEGQATDRVLFILATQDRFVGEGDRLLPNFVVQNGFADVSARLDAVRERGLVYAFTDGDVEGIDRNFRLQEPIATDGLLRLRVLQDESAVGGILAQIAREVACGEPEDDVAP